MRSVCLVLLTLSLTACGGPAVAPRDLARALAEDRSPLILDVRSAGEYRRGHIPGAVHVPFTEVAEKTPASVLERCRREPLVVTCEHGPRAVYAASRLRDLGCREVVLLEGHMARWRRLGLPLIRSEP